MSGSFFGDGFGLPDDPIARGRAAFLSGNANDLDAKLESLALNDNLAENLDEDLDTFNDQTFDADVSEIAGKDFDFYKSTMDNRSKVPFQMHSIHHQQQQQQQQQQQGGAMLDFSQRLQNMGVNFQQAPGIPPPTSSNPSALAATEAPEPRRGLTLAELEARMIPKQQQTQQQQQQQQQTSTSIPVLQTLLSAAQPAHVAKKATADPDVIAKRREERQRKEAELERYNNMMTRHDKEFIIRIQISQLLTDDPAADDFYCHMYQLSRGALFNPPSRPSSSQPQRPLQQHQQQSSASDTATPRSANTPAPAGTPTGPAHSEAQAAPAQPDVQNPIQSNAEAQQSAMTNASQSLGDRLQTAASTAPGAENKHQSQHSHHHHHHHLTRGNRSNTQSSMARMQQQVQRIVNEARRRPKASHVALEGALGKISVNSSRNPKQVIQVQRSHAGSVSQGHVPGQPIGDQKLHSPSPHDLGGIFTGLGDSRSPAAERRKTLRSIENVYSAVLRLEQLIREQVRLPPNPDHPSVQNWIAAYNEAKETAWNEIDASQPISNTYPHPLVRFLSFAKGKRIIPRLVHHLSIDQVLALTTTIIANFESLDVCRFGSFSYGTGSQIGARQREETDLFLHAVMPPALAFLAETSLQIVNGLFALFMERNNVAWVARTRPALAFLSMFLGRTEVLKQAGSHPFNAAAPVDKQEIYQAAELYGHLFNSLRGNFLAIFPPSPALGQQPNPIEDIHAWQFLATLAVSASVEQQHTLVAEVREKVLEKVQLANSGRLPMDIAAALTANVNLFLNALGLDASQVAL